MTSSSDIRPTTRLPSSGSDDGGSWFLWNFQAYRPHLNRGPLRTRHSDLTNTLLAMNLQWGSPCYEHTVAPAVNQTLWSRH